MLSCFRPDRFVQLLSLKPILILLLYLLVSTDLVSTDIRDLGYGTCPEGEEITSKIYLNCSGAETTSSPSSIISCQC